MLGMSQNKAIVQTSVRIRFLVTFHMETVLCVIGYFFCYFIGACSDR